MTISVSTSPMIDKVIASTDTAYRLYEGLSNVASVAGGSSGAAVATTVAFSSPLPTANYSVFVTPDQDATFYVTSKTTAGFTLTLLPRLAANTLAAGVNTVLVKYAA